MTRVPYLLLPLTLLCASADPGADPIRPRYTRLASGTGAFDWEGGGGRTDFVQWTDNMGGWRHLPVIRHGAEPNSIGIGADTPKMFLRLHHTDQAIPEGLTPETADFDGDGFCNLYEVLNGRDPLAVETLPDGDADGATDVVEQTRGTDPAAEDHPAVGLSVSECAP